MRSAHPAAGSAACRTAHGRPGRRRTASGPWWNPARSDPWRDPYAPAGLSAPAVYDEEAQPGPVVVDTQGRKKLRLRDLSIRLTVLALLVVLLMGAIGGGLGWSLTRPRARRRCWRPARAVPRRSGRDAGARLDLCHRRERHARRRLDRVRVGRAGATGSGVVIDGENGYIVTNNHVVSGADDVEGAEIRAVFSDGSGSAARIVGRDPASDIAVLKVGSPAWSPASLGSSDDVVVGDPVVAIGSPLGLAGTVTSGIVKRSTGRSAGR